MEDLVSLRDLRVHGRHGVSAEEQATAQEFAVDVECPTDAATAAASDDLADALDYRRLRDIAEAVIGGPPRQLVETLAEEIAERVRRELDRPWARVRVAKLRPGTIAGRASVEVTRGARAVRPPVELHVPDFGPVRDFYGRLGFVVEREEAGDDGYLVMRRGANALAFWPGNAAVTGHSFFGRFPAGTPRGIGVEIIVEVEDVEALYEKVRGFLRVVAPLRRRPWGVRDFRLEDPFGYYLRITERAP
ncbi:MAG: dihydroneopterin aldolase [Candidatus Limnocylindria bacterium]|nr:dihydroneopterin aldolase [Candidatus Limnocylindria bacterium]